MLDHTIELLHSEESKRILGEQKRCETTHIGLNLSVISKLSQYISIIDHMAMFGSHDKSKMDEIVENIKSGLELLNIAPSDDAVSKARSIIDSFEESEQGKLLKSNNFNSRNYVMAWSYINSLKLSIHSKVKPLIRGDVFYPGAGSDLFVALSQNVNRVHVVDIDPMYFDNWLQKVQEILQERYSSVLNVQDVIDQISRKVEFVHADVADAGAWPPLYDTLILSELSTTPEIIDSLLSKLPKYGTLIVKPSFYLVSYALDLDTESLFKNFYKLNVNVLSHFPTPFLLGGPVIEHTDIQLFVKLTE